MIYMVLILIIFPTAQDITVSTMYVALLIGPSLNSAFPNRISHMCVLVAKVVQLHLSIGIQVHEVFGSGQTLNYGPE